jgi:hypothetical protein
MTKICLILAMLRQAGQVNTAKNMKFREMVNTADYQVSPLFFSNTAKKIRFYVLPEIKLRGLCPKFQFLRPGSFLSGNIFFPIFGTVFCSVFSYTYFITKSCVSVGLGLDVSRDGNRPVAYSTLHCTENRIYVFPQKRNARPQSQFLYLCL